MSRPIEIRLNGLIAGIRSDIGIKIYGDDLEQLRLISDEVQKVLGAIKGVGEVTCEQLT